MAVKDKKINVSVVGATGYTGAELLRIAAGHPNISVTCAVSKSYAGKKMSDIYPGFIGADIGLSDAGADEIAEKSEFAFLCLPHGMSMEIAPGLLEKGLKVIDLSGDFRYDDTDIYEKWYGLEHNQKDINKNAVYGLPEFYKDDVAKANFVANPGCYTTTSILALAPLLKSGVVNADRLIIDAKSGVSGAGRKESLAFSFSEAHDNFKAYSVIGHRHTSEIEEQLAKFAGRDIRLQFTPHLLPVKRGILATVYADLADGVSEGDIAQAYERAYSGAAFTYVMEQGRFPELKHVVGSNKCVIGFDVSERTGRAVIVSCTDNLIKGASGQAVQNFNIMNGLDEAAGLATAAWNL